jgi:environmental stress-induced protein Ves
MKDNIVVNKFIILFRKEKLHMTYKLEYIPREKQNTSTWSGGTTTELAIYPPDSAYKERNFLWRLSSAVVDIEESTFTSLPGIWRHIMILEGELELRHEGRYNILLKPYDKDSFSGGWTTRSIGKARDFNLMLAEGCEGSINAVMVGKSNIVDVEAGQKNPLTAKHTAAYYCSAGEVAISTMQGEAFVLHTGDLLLVNGDITLKITGNTDAAIIAVEISY